ncbi:MAG: hypothetical protein K2Q14_01250 [Gammaproteobacteria bacterium]|nr:hypothetical protein [Gammaproteobacteria bacterium]
MKQPEDIQRLLTRRFASQHRQWLQTESLQHSWPLILSLDVPTERIAMRSPDAVRAWITAWKNWQGIGQLSWCERRWSILGTQRLPDKLVLENPEAIAIWVGQGVRWQQACMRYQSLVMTWPILANKLPLYFDLLADYSELDFVRLCDLLHWLIAHPKINLYPRQLPISGLDSKWLEGRKKIVLDLFAAIRGEIIHNNDFFACCGLKEPPRLIRMRILDHHLCQNIGGLTDFSAPLEDIARLNIDVKKVIIVENLQTGLALEDMPNTIVFMGLGYAVDIFQHIPWMKQVSCYYWGDIDTHGFAILNCARQYLPHLQSILMNNATLQHCTSLWGAENKPHSLTGLIYLTEEEQMFGESLKAQPGRMGQHIRLEQERIPWEYVSGVLRGL